MSERGIHGTLKVFWRRFQVHCRGPLEYSINDDGLCCTLLSEDIASGIFGLYRKVMACEKDIGVTAPAQGGVSRTARSCANISKTRLF